MRDIRVCSLSLIGDPTPMTLSAYEAVVLGGSVYGCRHARALRDFVKRHLEALREKPTAFFSTSLSAAAEDEAGRRGGTQDATYSPASYPRVTPL